MAGLGGNINIGYHGSPFYQDILGQGFKGGTGQSSQIFGRNLPSWGGSGGTYTTGNPGAALRYGAPIEVAQSARNFTLPFGGGIDKSGVSLGSETRLNPGQATKGMNLMQKLRSGIYSKSPMAQRLLSTGTTGGMGGASRLGLGALRLAGLTNPAGVAAGATYLTPKIINALTARDPDATKSSLFGIDLTRNANEQAALPDSNLNDWGFPSGEVPVAGDDIQETVTPPGVFPETENLIPPFMDEPSGLGEGYDKRRFRDIIGDKFSGILRGLGDKFKRPEAKQKEFDLYEQTKLTEGPNKGWGDIGGGYQGNIWQGSGGNKINVVDPRTGATVLRNKNFDSGFGSDSVEEMIATKEAWARKRRAKGRKFLSTEMNKWLDAIDAGKGGEKPPGQGPSGPLGGGAWVGGAPAYTGPGGLGGGETVGGGYQDPYDPGGGEAYGGLMTTHSRGRYNKGGRVGILSIF